MLRSPNLRRRLQGKAVGERQVDAVCTNKAPLLAHSKLMMSVRPLSLSVEARSFDSSRAIQERIEGREEDTIRHLSTLTMEALLRALRSLDEHHCRYEPCACHS